MKEKVKCSVGNIPMTTLTSKVLPIAFRGDSLTPRAAWIVKSDKTPAERRRTTVKATHKELSDRNLRLILETTDDGATGDCCCNCTGCCSLDGCRENVRRGRGCGRWVKVEKSGERGGGGGSNAKASLVHIRGLHLPT